MSGGQLASRDIYSNIQIRFIGRGDIWRNPHRAEEIPKVSTGFSTDQISIEEVAAEEGYFVLVRTKNYLENVERIFDEGRVEGFIFRNMDRTEEHERLFASLHKRDVPFVLIGNPLRDYPAITIDNIGGG